MAKSQLIMLGFYWPRNQKNINQFNNNSSLLRTKHPIFAGKNSKSLDPKIALSSHNLLSKLFTHGKRTQFVVCHQNEIWLCHPNGLISLIEWTHSIEVTRQVCVYCLYENKFYDIFGKCECTHLSMSLSKLISNNSITNALSTRIIITTWIFICLFVFCG